MRATNTFQALCLGALLGLTGCVSVHHDHEADRYEPDYAYDDDYDPPAYGPRYRQYGVEHVYDVNLGVYTVVGYPHTYWSDGWYWRHAHGYWERCARPSGGRWSRADWAYVPHRLRPRYGDWPGSGQERWDRRDERGYERRERAEERHDRRNERVDARNDERDERWHDRFDSKQQRHDQRNERAEQQRDERYERKAERHELGDGRHDGRDERWQARQEKKEQQHDRREPRAEQQHDQRAQQQAERHERKAERRDDRRDARDYAQERGGE